MICCDTSFLISLYSKDAHSPSVLEFINHNVTSLTLTQFNYFEFCSALHLSEFRKKLPKNEVALFIANFEKDLLAKKIVTAPCNLEVILIKARKFSSQHTTKEGYRAFDIIHVAAALHLDAKTFLTFDKKQQSLAKNLGLETPL